MPFCAGFFFFFASPDEEGANVVAVFFTNLFKFLSNEEDDDDVEAEAEAESLSPVAIVAFSLSSFVAFTTTCPWTKDDCSFRGKRIDDALRLFPFKAFKEDKEDFEASASFLQQFDEDETLRDDPLHNVVVKVVVIVFAFVFTLRSRTISLF